MIENGVKNSEGSNINITISASSLIEENHSELGVELKGGLVDYELSEEEVFNDHDYDNFDLVTEKDLDESILNHNELYNQITHVDSNSESIQGSISSRESEADTDNDNCNIYDERDLEEEDLHEMMNKINICSDNVSDLQFVSTTRNGRKLIRDGYSYVRDR